MASQEHRSKQLGEGGDAVLLLDLGDWLPYRCSVIANRVSACLQSMYGERYSLSVPGWRVMAVLGRYAPLSAKEVADRTAMDQVQVTRAINQMATVGLISRRVDQADRRRVALRLSRKGLSAYGEIVPLARTIEARLLDILSPEEKASLSAVTAKLMARAEEVLPDAASWRSLIETAPSH